MKNYKKFIIAVLLLIALGFTSPVIGVTYYEHTAITAPDINSHSDNDTVFAGGDYTVTCIPSTDTDKYCDHLGWHYPSDNIVHTWSGPGTFDPTTGISVTWTAPAATGDANVTVTADDTGSPNYYDSPSVSDTVTLNVVFDHAFSVLDDSDANMAIFDNLGNLFLKGTMDQNSTQTASAEDEFIIENSAGSELAIIDANDGNMYIDGQVFQNQGTLTPSGTNNFIIEDSSGNTVAYIDDPNGDLYLKKALYEQVL